VIGLALLFASVSSAPAWLDQAFQGRAGSRWSGTVSVDRPGPAATRDTGKVCREGTSERLDFVSHSHFMAGDTMVFLDNASRSAWTGPRRRFPSPPDGGCSIVRTEKLLGRTVSVVELQDPRGRGRRLWVDTTIPLVLRSEHLAPAPGGPERQFLSIQVGGGCPPGSFQIPAGWAIKQGPPPAPRGPDGRVDAKHRRHPVSTLKELIDSVGFTPPPPPWLPPGFAARNWAWVETREGKAAQVLYDNGDKNLSIFYRPGTEHPPLCPPDGCKDREGRAVYFGRVGDFGLAVTGNLPPDQMGKVAGNRK
jgi:hypothetical protein